MARDRGPQRRNRVDRAGTPHAKLDDVTRPRPPIGPAMAGAVGLAGLKQSAPSSSDAAAGGSATPIGTEINEANFEEEVLLRSNEMPVVVLLWSPRSDVCLQLADILSGLAAADNGK